jgi:hypothetical protein
MRAPTLLAATSLLTLTLAGGQPPAGPAASAKTWIGREAAIETQLRTAVVSDLEEIGTGVTHPRRGRLTPAEPVASLVWKVLPPGRRDGFWESYKSEIAAYELDKLLELHMVPPAIERRIDGDTGAAIMWLDGVRSVKESGGQVPSGEIWGRAIRRMQMFDNFIGNNDRNAGNILIGPPGELILIDHSRAFITDRGLPQEFQRVDGELWDRMKALAQADLSRTLGAWIDRAAIGGMLERRKRMIAQVDKLLARQPQALVIVR